MPVAHRLDGPQPGGTAESSVDAALVAALAQATEIAECDSLLCHLSLSWRDITRAEFVILAVQSAAGNRYRVVVSDPKSSPTLADYALPRGEDLLEGLRARFASGSAGLGCVEASVELTGKTLVQGAEAWPIGGMLISGETPLPEDADRRFLQATAALLARAIDYDRRLQSAKLESLAQFAAGAGHEINNPLAAISGRAQLLLRDETDPQRRRHLQTIGAQALRIRDMIGDTMLFARPPVPEPQQLNLCVVLDAVLDRFSDDVRSRNLTCRREFESDVPIWADETQLCVVISELIRNAIEASPGGRTVRIVAAREIVNGCPWAKLSVRDEGAGLSVEAARHLFDPFYSGREAGRGLGFGLSKCWRIVTNHGGRIDVKTERETGFSIAIRWPACDRPIAAGELFERLTKP